MPERRCRFDDVLTEIVTRRSASSSNSSGRAQVQCASVSRGAEQADAVEIFDDAVGKIPVRPFALIARFEQMHVDAAPGARRGLALSPSSSSAEHHWTAGRTVLHVEGLLCTAAATALDQRDLFGHRQRRLRMKRRCDLGTRRPRAAPRASAPTGRRPADSGRAAPARSRCARRCRAPPARLPSLPSHSRSAPAPACDAP